MKKITLCLSVFLALVSGAFAADSKVITLQDGSRVKGELIGIQNGYYTVRTASMGEVRVADQDVASITAGEPAQPPTSAQPPAAIPTDIKSTPEFKSIQNKVLSDPHVMSEIQKLIQDPEVIAVLSDPSFAAAIQSGNTATLQSDPRLKRLSENPKIKALIEKIKGQQ